ncbi:hypothetical protein ACFPFV_12750 [Salinicoccus siamensis]|uniref:hypothetical protein n=1 Tax=Salinicoccus siamensis TaxID=381830 RepID=UPI00360D70C2
MVSPSCFIDDFLDHFHLLPTASFSICSFSMPASRTCSMETYYPSFRHDFFGAVHHLVKAVRHILSELHIIASDDIGLLQFSSYCAMISPVIYGRRAPIHPWPCFRSTVSMAFISASVSIDCSFRSTEMDCAPLYNRLHGIRHSVDIHMFTSLIIICSDAVP